MDVKNWHENLPEQCPPKDAIEPNGFVCFRLCAGVMPTDNDFMSHRYLFPKKEFNVPECRALSLSVFGDIADSHKLKLLPLHRQKKIFRLVLGEEHGVIQKNGRDSHYSWWRSAGCLPAEFAEAVE